ncbi:MAG: endonuclease [Deltaproteobacteria bacterium]|nr:endonuclease [Deltaproteobacteria bacterium]
MDTKLKADVAESAVITELLKKGFKVLKPVGDRLSYDLALDIEGNLLRIQVKSAWHDVEAKCYVVDARRTKTNRRKMVRDRYEVEDFDFAILYIDDLGVFYVMPVSVFISYGSTISLIEEEKRQRKPKSAEYRNRWDLLSIRAPQPERVEDNLSNSVKPGKGNTEPRSGVLIRQGVETRRQAPEAIIAG